MIDLAFASAEAEEALPVRLAVIVPAAKLPEPSLATRKLLVLEAVASRPIVTDVPPTEVLTYVPSVNCSPLLRRSTLPVPVPPEIESDVLIATLAAAVSLPFVSTVNVATSEDEPYEPAVTAVLSSVRSSTTLSLPLNDTEGAEPSPVMLKLRAVVIPSALVAVPSMLPAKAPSNDVAVITPALPSWMLEPTDNSPRVPTEVREEDTTPDPRVSALRTSVLLTL